MKSERELRTLTEQSQDDGFRAIFDQYCGYVSTIVWNHIQGIGTQQDVEEAVSDVFADLFRNFDTIKEGKLESYIRMLAKRTSIDAFRGLAARPDKPFDKDEAWNQAVSDENIVQEQEQAALRHELLQCIWSLGEPDSTIIIWKYFYECSAEQIGKQVGLNRLAVRKRLSRARAKLQKLLTDKDITL